MSPAAVSSGLPHSAHTAAQQALQAALNDPSNTADKGKMEDQDERNSPREEGEELEGQEIDAPAGLGSLPLNETARTVFDDPMTFNVKVRVEHYGRHLDLMTSAYACCIFSTHCTLRGHSGSIRRRPRARQRAHQRRRSQRRSPQPL